LLSYGCSPIAKRSRHHHDTLIDLRKPYRSAENAGFPYHLLSQCDVDHTSPPFNAQKFSLTSN
jgi:hypothetical protein